LIECLLILEHKIDSPAKLMSKNGQGFSFAVFVSKSVQISFCRLIAFKEKDCCFAEGPLEMRIADL